MNQQHALNEIKRTNYKLLLIYLLIHKVASFFYLNVPVYMGWDNDLCGEPMDRIRDQTDTVQDEMD